MKPFWEAIKISMSLEMRGIGVIAFWIIAQIAITIMRKVTNGDKTTMRIYIVWVNFIVILMTLFFMYCPM